MKDNIYKYIEQGIIIFACNKNKTPATAHGFYDASSSIEVLEKQFHDPENMLIGMPTGNGNNLVIIDIDIGKPLQNEKGERILDNDGNVKIDPRTHDEILEELENLVGKLPDTFQTQTPSGGRHRWYKVPYTDLSSSSRFFRRDLSVDIKGNNGYVIVPDGKTGYIVYDDVNGLEIEDIRSRCADLPESIEKYKKRKEETESDETKGNVLPPEEVREIRSALSFLDPDPRDNWIRIGMALKSTGSITAKGLYIEWSRRSNKYNPEDQEKSWASFKPSDITIATVFHEAKKSGWVTTYDNKSHQLQAQTLPTPPKIWSGTELMSADFPEIKFLIPGILPNVGQAILVAPPKFGKSWWGLDLIVSIATGREIFGIIATQTDTLYISLEDTTRRLKSRLFKQEAPQSDRFHITTTWPQGDAGIHFLRQYLSENISIKFIVIDTLMKFYPVKDGNDYIQTGQALGKIKNIADELERSILMIHHTVKAETGDFVSKVLGSTGIAGNCDTILVATRERDNLQAKLSVTGRDIEENEFNIFFDKAVCRWNIYNMADNLIKAQREKHGKQISDNLPPKGMFSRSEK